MDAILENKRQLENTQNTDSRLRLELASLNDGDRGTVSWLRQNLSHELFVFGEGLKDGIPVDRGEL
jgi:hypothetical protein